MKQCNAKIIVLADRPAQQCVNFGPTVWISTKIRGRLPYNVTTSLCWQHISELRSKIDQFLVVPEEGEKDEVPVENEINSRR